MVDRTYLLQRTLPSPCHLEQGRRYSSVTSRHCHSLRRRPGQLRIPAVSRTSQTNREVQLKTSQSQDSSFHEPNATVLAYRSTTQVESTHRFQKLQQISSGLVTEVTRIYLGDGSHARRATESSLPSAQARSNARLHCIVGFKSRR
jgi:hypothetical protein